MSGLTTYQDSARRETFASRKGVRRKAKSKWIQSAVKNMKRKGTLGKFGKATIKKIARAKRVGGVQKKRAVFAENMRKILRKRYG